MPRDGQTLGPSAKEIDGCDAVINLAGRSVSCRYTDANLRAMMDSRVESARVVGEAIARAERPPKVWLQMSTATIYSHRFDAANDEATGVIGGDEPGVPGYWAFSVAIAKAWEEAQQQAETPHTRKVALRSAIVMSPDRGGAFDVLLGMARLGLGGPGGAPRIRPTTGQPDSCAFRPVLRGRNAHEALDLAFVGQLLPRLDGERQAVAGWG